MKNNGEGEISLYQLVTDMEKNIGRRIRKKRLELGLTQQGLAKKIGLSYQQVQKYETGANRISAGRLWLIATVLKTDIQYFITTEDDLLGRIFSSDLDPPSQEDGPSEIDQDIKTALANLVSALTRKSR